MCIFREVCSTKTVSVDPGRIPVPLPAVGDGGAYGSTTLATLNALLQVLPHLALNTLHTLTLPIFPLSLDSCTKEET